MQEVDNNSKVVCVLLSEKEIVAVALLYRDGLLRTTD